MTLYGMRELIDGFRSVYANAIQIAEDIPAGRYDFRPTPESRSAGETLVHIAWLGELTRRLHGESRPASLADFNFAGLAAETRAEELTPRAKAQIVELLREESERFVAWLEQLPEAVAAERVTMPNGGSPNRFEMILGIREHQVHHTAQLTVHERLAGVVPHFTRALMSMSEQPLAVA